MTNNTYANYVVEITGEDGSTNFDFHDTKLDMVKSVNEITCISQRELHTELLAREDSFTKFDKRGYRVQVWYRPSQDDGC